MKLPITVSISGNFATVGDLDEKVTMVLAINKAAGVPTALVKRDLALFWLARGKPAGTWDKLRWLLRLARDLWRR